MSLFTCKPSFVLSVFARKYRNNVGCFFFLTNQWLQPLGHVSPSPSPAEVKIKALSSQAEEGSLLTAAPGCVESSFILRGNLTFAGPKEFNKDPRPPARPPATPHTLNRSRQRWLDKLICIQARCCRWSRSAHVKKPEASPLGSSHSTRQPPPLPHHSTPPPLALVGSRWRRGGYAALFPTMDSFINQKEIAAGWEEWKEGRRGGQRLCSRVKSGLSAEGQRCVGRAVPPGPLHGGSVSFVHSGRRLSRSRRHRRDPEP